MLPRALEAEVMGTEAEARDYDAMDFAEVNRAFVAAWTGFVPILDVCTGTARIPIELVRQHPINDLHVVAVDLADHMLAVATRNVEAAGLADRITLAKADAKHLPFPDEHFGAVICNGSLQFRSRSRPSPRCTASAPAAGRSSFATCSARPTPPRWRRF